MVEGDEQFYLLVGDRVLGGALPYVDIWDRKPVGLFLLYAATRLLGGEGIVQYQLVATLFAAATAFVILRIGEAAGSRRGGLLAGAAYLLWLGAFGGEGGQAPVFYNLPVAAAAWLALRAVAHPGTRQGVLALGAASMLATGLAMQIKYTAVFEGVFLGLALLRAARRAGGGWGFTLAAGAAWVLCALLPTAAALGAYAALGEARAFVFANFLSIFGRDTAALGSSLPRLAAMAGLLLPVGLCAVLGLMRAWRAAEDGPARRTAAFLAGWAGTAVAGVLLFGTYYNHYALPLLPPLLAAAAPLLGRPGARIGKVPAAPALLALGAIATAVPAALHLRSRGDGREVRTLAAAIPPGATLYVFDGEPILYHLARGPLPTPYVFPTHLNDLREAGGTGVDPVAELRRILAARPDFVVTSGGTRPRINPESRAVLAASLAADYREVRRVRIGNRDRILHGRIP